MHSVYCADMAAARYSSDVLQMFYGPIPREEADMAAERHSSYVQIFRGHSKPPSRAY